MDSASFPKVFASFSIFAIVGLAGVALAHHAEHSKVDVRELSRTDISEKLDGEDASVTVVEVTFEPGQEDVPHTHAGPVFGYVLEGEYEHAIDDQPVTTYKAGDTFYEPSGRLHRVARNASGKSRTKLLAVILSPRETKEVTTPKESGH